MQSYLFMKNAEDKAQMSKSHQKLLKLSIKAQECIDRKQAKKLIKKAEKLHSKLSD